MQQHRGMLTIGLLLCSGLATFEYGIPRAEIKLPACLLHDASGADI